MMISFAGLYARREKKLADRRSPLAESLFYGQRPTANGQLLHFAAMPMDEASFKLALSHFASGVTVVTTEHEGKQYGMTVASFASLSLHPPLVLICIEKSVKTHDAIAAAGKFGVSILGAEQEQISARFASRAGDKFSGVKMRRGELGVPLIAGALTTLECSVYDQLPGGDHSIFVGEVVGASTGEGSPLIYFRSGYREMRI